MCASSSDRDTVVAGNQSHVTLAEIGGILGELESENGAFDNGEWGKRRCPVRKR
jgi:hypothetical protein